MSETSPVTYIPNFVPDHAEWFARLWGELEWEQRPDAPRREYWTNLLNRPYTYGAGRGIRTYEPKMDHTLIIAGREKIADHVGVMLEGCFLNGYENSRNWLGWHEDDDPGIDHSKPIAVITIGQGRPIEFREVLERPGKGNKGVFGETVSVMLESGSLLLMHAGMQSTHQHRIPKVGHEVKPRISLTYRGLVAAE
jgi:alkylated DNA repair dioxygenase AlkB